MTKRLEIYEWPRDYRKNAEDMYSVARGLLLRAREARAKAKLEPDSVGRGYMNGVALGYRLSAASILIYIRDGRDVDEFYRRQLYRDCVQRVCVGAESKNLGGAMYNAMHIMAAGLDTPEFDSTPRV